ncbi:hypothetical protein [Halopelagius fulvigenes]|uniref:Halobacterial output domain-containing protein n=1 Tax=Halopelagius fulvigenes TaxID=1198324 RepID=A0ABD5TYS0_9EURY
MDETQLPAVDGVDLGELLTAWLESQGLDLEDSEEAFEYVCPTEVTLTREGHDTVTFDASGTVLELSADYEIERES